MGTASTSIVPALDFVTPRHSNGVGHAGFAVVEADQVGGCTLGRGGVREVVVLHDWHHAQFGHVYIGTAVQDTCVCGGLEPLGSKGSPRNNKYTIKYYANA